MEVLASVTQIRNSLLKSCSYIIESCSGLLAVDAGDYAGLIECARRKNLPVIGILLTHCHHDHTCGLERFLNEFPSVPVYCGRLTAEGLQDSIMNLSFMDEEHAVDFSHMASVRILPEGMALIGGLSIEVIPTPGHADDCISYIVGGNIFTGDSYIPHAKVFCRWPRSDRQQALHYEQWLKELSESRNLCVCPGHWQ